MFTDAKVLLSIELQGGTLIRESEPVKINYRITKGDLKSKKNLPKTERDKVVKGGQLPHYNLSAKPATLSISLNQDAYNFMTSDEAWDYSIVHEFNISRKQWRLLPAEKRLEAHLKRMVKFHKGKGFTYSILD